MIKKTFFLLLFLSIGSFAQSKKADSSLEENSFKDSNSWAIGGGISNFIMHGDLRSIGTGSQGNFLNFGGYLYVDKMFNPLLGLELKLNYTRLSGGTQYFSEIYEILYVDNIYDKNNLVFDGRAYGAELNLILSFTNLYEKRATKWHLAGYFGVGYHQYNSALYVKEPGKTNTKKLLVDFGHNPIRNNQNEASSIFLSTQLGIKKRVNKNIDVELRTGMYFNYEDHLDAAISSKQNWETFFLTNLGLTFKLGKKKVFTIWGGQLKTVEEFKIIDSDGDGVIDELDIEPNTPKGVLVYGNGTAVDTDKDKVPDYKDKCPFKYGTIQNNGCPIIKDSDNDGISDEEDLCPNEFGLKNNKGCTKQEEKTSNGKIMIPQNIGQFTATIFFSTGKFTIDNNFTDILNKIAKEMVKMPDVKFYVEGHADSVDPGGFNLYLSEKRANAVKNYLIKKGVLPNQLLVKGYGESRPRFSNETKESRQLNRRVEIYPSSLFD